MSTNFEFPDGLDGWPLDLAIKRFSASHHGDFDQWLNAIESLPPMNLESVHYNDTVTIRGEVNAQALSEQLMHLHPWRKGPFRIGEVFIDTEWRSDWKWQRLQSALGKLSGRVLDIGCGNGYFGWRMLDAGASQVIGVDPTLLFCMQHQAISTLTGDRRNWVLPLKVEELPATQQFDTVFSMGVIYHRRDPVEHTDQLAALTLPGGRVVLESLVVEGPDNLYPTEQHPSGRYARMRNVWCVPTAAQMCDWLTASGFVDTRIIDVTTTSLEEQHSTQWMNFDSLVDSLDPNDTSKTVEGHPAPRRATIMAHKPVIEPSSANA